MSKPTDDMREWAAQRNNRAQPFPYTYPQMPPQFRRCKCISKFLLLAEYVADVIAMLSLLAVGVLHWLFGGSITDGAVVVCALLFMLTFPLWFLFRLLRCTPRLYWHCPGCKEKFPYYKPVRYRDVLVHEECLREMKFLHIPYVQPKLCPLIIPSECPYCRKKFWAQEKGLEG